MCTSTQLGQDLIRIFLHRSDATELLLDATPDGFRLPVVAIPLRARTAREITSAIQSRWSLETYCLFPFTNNASQLPVRYQVVELWQPDEHPPAGMQWHTVVSLSADAFEDSTDYTAILKLLATLDQYRQEELPGSFGKPGWLRTVKEWVAAEAAAAGLSLTGKFRQLNASPTFSLIRFETNGRALWFKATGEPNLHELPVSRFLAQFYPSFVPTILAVREQWNAWLSAEVPGEHLDENSPLCSWTAIAKTLANLQIASMRDAFHLRELGCKDVSPCSLLREVDRFLEVIGDFMQQQTKPSPAPLSQAQLGFLGAQLRDALSLCSNLGIANTLGHLDFSPGNILVSPDDCIFIDWAAACVGPPFLTFQFLLERLRQIHPLEESWEQKLLSEYSASWRSFLPPRAITEAMAVAPTLAVFTYATANATWRDATRLCDPSTAAYFRSLARRVHQEADRWSSRQTPLKIFSA